MSEGTKRPAIAVQGIAEQLVELLRPACERIEVAGSLRRRLKMIGDIELVAIPKIEVVEQAVAGDLFGAIERVRKNRLWDRLTEVLAGRDTLNHGEKYRKFLWPTPDGEPIKVDLFTASAGNWGLILLIRTGSATFSEYVVTQLGNQGRPSHEGWVRSAPHRGHFTDKEKAAMPTIQTPTEQSVFELASLKYRDPWSGRE